MKENVDLEIAKFKFGKKLGTQVQEFLDEVGKDGADITISTMNGDAILTSDGRACKGKIILCNIDVYDDENEEEDEE